jgi:hypothetical protein
MIKHYLSDLKDVRGKCGAASYHRRKKNGSSYHMNSLNVNLATKP